MMYSFQKRLLFVAGFVLSFPLISSADSLQDAIQAQRQRQQMLQQQAIAQQMIAQKQAVAQQQQQLIIQAQQKAIQQQRAAVQQQQVQQVKAYQQRALQQQQAYNQAVEQKVAQEVATRQLVQQQMYNQSVQQRALQEAADQAKANLISSQTALAQAQTQTQSQTFSPSSRSSQIADEVTDLEHIWQELDISSEIWPKMMDREPKELTINRFIESYRQSGIYIRKPAAQYVDIIDSMMSGGSSPMMKAPFKDVLKIAAIVEYDFDNGIDKDQMALKILGQQGFEANKKRLGR